MQRSEQIGALAAALAKAQGDIKSAAKATRNTFYNSSYADLAAVMEACRVPLSKNGIAVIQSTQYDTNGKWIETILVHSSGEWVSSHYPVKPVKDDPQGMGSAVTYARRYALMALVGIVADDDDDGNAASSVTNGNGQPRPAPVQEPARRAAPPPPENEAKKWAQGALTTVKGFETLNGLHTWSDRNKSALDRLKAVDVNLYRDVDQAIAEQQARLSPLNG